MRYKFNNILSWLFSYGILSNNNFYKFLQFRIYIFCLEGSLDKVTWLLLPSSINIHIHIMHTILLNLLDIFQISDHSIPILLFVSLGQVPQDPQIRVNADTCFYSMLSASILLDHYYYHQYHEYSSNAQNLHVGSMRDGLMFHWLLIWWEWRSIIRGWLCVLLRYILSISIRLGVKGGLPILRPSSYLARIGRYCLPTTHRWSWWKIIGCWVCTCKPTPSKINAYSKSHQVGQPSTETDSSHHLQHPSASISIFIILG